MIQKYFLLKDERLKIDEEAYNNVFRRPIIFYRIINIPVGKIKREKKGKLISLTESCVFRWLNYECTEEEYLEYCQKNNYDKKDRSPQLFRNLIDEVKISGYKPERGIIVIDQYKCIVDGLHRSTILLKTFGDDYKIPVLKIHYFYRTPKRFIQNCIYNYEKRMEKFN